MPVPTKQATPGPSTAGAPETNAQPSQANSKKRHGLEMAEDTREAKKAKVEGEVSVVTVSSKDKKKNKKKKKKRRLSVVPPTAGRVNFKSRSTTLSSPRLKPIPNGRATSVTSLKLEVCDDGEPTRSSSDKGKGKAQSEFPARRASTPQSEKPEVCAPIIDQSFEIAHLQEQLASQTTLLERHRTHLASHQQSLTCQICLDLLHKPYALAPCGHITCYGCLVRWFTAPQNPDNNLNAAAVADDIDTILDGRPARNGTYRRRRKNCPVCRAEVTGRPVEMWDIKGMVASLVRSELVDLPVPVQPPAAEEGSNDSARDPWRNLFLQITPQNRRQFGAMGPGFEFFTGQHPPVDGDRERMGWLDAEDGGIYRCIDCHNEIVDGRCSLCDRRYPGHPHAYDDDDDENEDDEDEDDDDDGDMDPMHFHGGFQRIVDALISDEDVDVDDEVDDDHLNSDERAAREEIMWHVRRPQVQAHRRGAAEYNMYGAADHFMDEDDEGSDDGSYDYAIPPPVARDQALLRRAVAPFRRARGPQRRGPGGNAGIVDAVFGEDEDQDDDDEDSQYDGSFIDDDEDHHEAGAVDELIDVDDDDDDEVEIVDVRPRTSGTTQLRRRADVLLSSDDNVEVREIENPRLLARQLGRRSRQPLHRRLSRTVDQDRDMDLQISDEDGEDETSEEDEEIPVSRGVVRRLPRRLNSVLSAEEDTDEGENAY